MSGTIHLIKKNNLINLQILVFIIHQTYQKNIIMLKYNFKDLKVIYNDPRRFGFFKFIENKQGT